jgi:MFS family permease
VNAVSGPANLAGTLLCASLADRFRRRSETFIFACGLFALTWMLMSRATTWQQLTALNVLAGFSFGMCTNMILIMTGLLAEASSRGRRFGALTFVSLLSLLITGLLWGPIAGFYAKQESVPLSVVPMESANMPMQMDYRITMGVRYNEPEWKRKVNGLIRKHQAEINKILLDYGVPLLDSQGKPLTQ